MRLVWAVIPLILIGIVGVQESLAEQASGKSAWVTNSEKVCGDKLCSEVLDSSEENSNDFSYNEFVRNSTLERHPAKNLRVIDEYGNSHDIIPVGQPMRISTDLSNYSYDEQEFTFLIQIQNIDGVVNSLTWITGSLDSGQSISPAILWTPIVSGNYTATAFAWKSIENPISLMPSISMTIHVTDDVTFSKIIIDDVSIKHSTLAGIPQVHYSSLEYPEFIQVGDKFDVTVRWTFTEYDEEGNVEHQNIPLNTLTKEVFDESLLQIKIPENVEMITGVSDWGKTEKIYYDSSYNFNSTFTTFSKTTPFDYTNAMHEQTYQFKLVGPFFPPFDTITFSGLGFGKTIYHQDGSLLHDNLDPKFIQKSQSEITVEKLGIVNPQYPEVSPSEVNWKNAYDITPKGINTPVDTNTISFQCSLVHGGWSDEYNECVPHKFPLESCRDGLCQERFENFCSEFNGEYHSCHSGCRHSPDWPNVICSAVCVKVCEFK